MFTRPLRLPQSSNSLVQRSATRPLVTAASSNYVNIMEVGPRDGLQNEKSSISVETKVDLINRLGRAGMKRLETGSFVSPKWVPQMAGTAEVIRDMERLPDARYSVLVPNLKGLENLFTVLSEYSSSPSSSSAPPPTNEIAVIVAATEAFSQANTNCSIAESLDRTRKVTQAALEKGLRVRGYVAVVITCPYSGKVDYAKVRDIAKELLEMGCYEVSLGDTTGTGNPHTVSEMLETVMTANSVDKLAVHFHDTFGMGIANVMAALSFGVRTIDSSIGGLGGCPYSPGATGNVATEDVLYALKDSQYTASGDLDALVDIGNWISGKVGRSNSSRVGTAMYARKLREEKIKSKL